MKHNLFILLLLLSVFFFTNHISDAQSEMIDSLESDLMTVNYTKKLTLLKENCSQITVIVSERFVSLIQTKCLLVC